MLVLGEGGGEEGGEEGEGEREKNKYPTPPFSTEGYREGEASPPPFSNLGDICEYRAS